jgi:cleavage and polyadenylation specificity factor subunit 1
MINYYHRFIPKAAEALAGLNELCAAPKKSPKLISWTKETEHHFLKTKESLATATLLYHPKANSEIAIVSDASDKAIGAALQQRVDGNWQPLGFFFRKLTPPQQRYGTFDRELLAIYQALRYFRHQIEGRNFTVYTDHKPLIGATKSTSDKYTGRQFRHLDFIAQMTSDVRHIKGIDNIVADCLSRVHIDSIEPLSLNRIAQAQQNDEEMKTLVIEGKLTEIELREPDGKINRIIVNNDRPTPRPYIPASLRRQIFDAFHNLAHPGIKTTKKIISEKFTWPNMKKQIVAWGRSCIPCQRAKVTRHTKSPTSRK